MASIASRKGVTVIKQSDKRGPKVVHFGDRETKSFQNARPALGYSVIGEDRTSGGTVVMWSPRN
ncbi:MAG: hypothetical protein CTY15_06595 [Methylocystis sp.]|nr:MAG: hypothetical protein CTY15_06595 [Methylocystis sp.]